MSWHQKSKKKRRLNKELCPEEFELFVPKQSKLLGDWESPEDWEDYLKSLLSVHELPEKYEHLEEGWTCDCKRAWVLRGDLAVKHACQVHDRIQSQVLGLEQVNAIDVGFAIREQQTKFEDFLAIRVHVNKKLPPELLIQAGLSDLTLIDHAMDQRSNDRSKPQPYEVTEPCPCDRPTDDGMDPYDSLFNVWYPYPCTSPPDLSDPNPCEPHHDPCDPPPPTGCDKQEFYCRVLKILKEQRNPKRRGHCPDSPQSQPTQDFPNRDLRYPIRGVRPDDLSLYCPRKLDETCTLEDIRLCISGVPIDVINAQYKPSTTHPGGDADSGTFVDRPKRSDQLGNDEHLLVGRGRTNPLVGGISVGSVTGQAGTLSAVVWDRTDGTPCVLSNWHVLAGGTNAQVGQPTYQPALFDGGTQEDVVAHLKRWHLGEKGDAAIAELSGSRHYASGEILGLWHPVSGYMKPHLNMKIRKWGRTTGFTRGFVDGIHLATNIDYGNGVVRSFKNQFHIAPIFAGDDVSQVGDSGSLIVTSFRPTDLEEDRTKLIKWLQLSCKSTGTKTLCEDIEKGLDDLIADCGNAKVYQTPADVLKCAKCEIGKIERDCDCGPDPRKLCKKIKKYRRKLKRKCKPLIDCDRFRAHVLETLDLLARECDKDECGIRTRVVKSLERLKRDYREFKCGDYGFICEFLNCAYADFAGLYPPSNQEKLKRYFTSDCNASDKLCDKIRYWHCGFSKAGEDLAKAAQICRCADSSFKDWYKRCFIERLCKVIHDSCKETCRSHPAALVRCIEENLLMDMEADKEKKFAKGYGKEYHGTMKIRRVLRSMARKDGFDPDEFLEALRDNAKQFKRKKKDAQDREATRVYYAVGLAFAGDTPGSPFGEFAVASDISELADELRFSLRPVFEPRSSFRELRVRPQVQRQIDRAVRSITGLSPGDQDADPRGGGPQPEIESGQSDSGGPGG